MMEQVKETLEARVRDDSLSINQKIGMVKFTILVTFTVKTSFKNHAGIKWDYKRVSYG